MRKYVPSYSGTLRSHGLTLPHCISECSGIRIFGKRIKSIAFSTDAAIIKTRRSARESPPSPARAKREL